MPRPIKSAKPPESMTRTLFIPKRDRRHRIAAVALIRALIRTGQKISLPPDLQPSGPTHPVVHTIKKRVAKNKDFSSPRLIYASMAAGYRVCGHPYNIRLLAPISLTGFSFLTMLTKAQSESSPEHTLLITHLRARALESATSRQTAQLLNPPRPRPPLPREPNRPPLLTMISRPDEPPEYVSTIRPLPKSHFSGERKVPVLSGTSDGNVPFLRVAKPQPRRLSRSIRQKRNLQLRRSQQIIAIDEEREPFARDEDAWDAIVEDALAAEGLAQPDTTTTTPEEPPFTYARSEQLSRRWLTWRNTLHWADLTARGRALARLIEEEKALAVVERAMPAWTDEQSRAATATIEAEYRQRRAIQPAERSPPVADPFDTPEWREQVRLDDERRAARAERDRDRGRPPRFRDRAVLEEPFDLAPSSHAFYTVINAARRTS